MFLPIVVLCVTLFNHHTEAANEDLLNYCLDSMFHKKLPGPEDALHRQCSPWKDRSCCTGNTTIHAHSGSMYGFSHDHCPNHKMSDKCKEHFTQDLCFYECSPNIGPWIQRVDMKIRNERFFEVPLCASDCNSWFEACKDDYTCTDNWVRNFEWKNGKNVCPPNSECRTFQEIFVDAKNFCETVWDGSWKYTDDDQYCMRMWFDGTRGNPNDAVARWKVTGDSGSSKTTTAISLIILSTFVGLSNSNL